MEQGYALVSVDPAQRAPVGSAIFQFRDAGGTVSSEAGVGSVPATPLSRIFVDNAGTLTGVAVASDGGSPATVTFRLLQRSGHLISSTDRTLATGGKLAIFVNELFPDLPIGFTGILEIEGDEPLVPITLKFTVNSRGEGILTTLPIVDLTRPHSDATLIFPQVGFGAGFSTRLILINPDPDTVASGTLRFFDSSGSSLEVILGTELAQQVSFTLPPGGGRQTRPGDPAVPVSIIVDAFDLAASEFPVVVGEDLHLQPVVLDSAGQFRDDFDFLYQNLDPEIVSVDAVGRVEGLAAGFATLILSAGDTVASVVISSVEVVSGVEGFQATGLAQDLANRIYVADETMHAILRADDLFQTPVIFAGIDGQPGFRDGSRAQAQFTHPSYLAFDQSSGSLYVSDSANDAIRRVDTAEEDGGETLLGSGSVPASSQPALSDPRGIALDGQGGLWIADSGHHVIRRLDLASGVVTPMAGSEGVSLDSRMGPTLRPGLTPQSESPLRSNH